MQRQPRAGLIEIEQAGVRLEVGVACSLSGLGRERLEDRWHCRPRFAAWIHILIAITTVIADPSETAATRHRDRHGMAAWCRHVTKRRRVADTINCSEQFDRERSGYSAQN